MISRIQQVTRFGVSMATFPIRFALIPFESSIRQWGDRETKKVLNEYGLKYHDIMIETPDMLAAIERLSPTEKQDMERRITRAFDCSLKQKPIPAHMQVGEHLDESDFYLKDHLEAIEELQEERNKLNWY